MIDRQRAFVSALVYVVKNELFPDYHSVGVKRLPDEARMYEFNGKWKQNLLSIYDDKGSSIVDSQFYDNPWGVEITWTRKHTDRIKIRIPKEGNRFYGLDGDNFRFEGVYYSPYRVEIRDLSQDAYRYVYRIQW